MPRGLQSLEVGRRLKLTALGRGIGPDHHERPERRKQQAKPAADGDRRRLPMTTSIRRFARKLPEPVDEIDNGDENCR